MGGGGGGGGGIKYWGGKSKGFMTSCCINHTNLCDYVTMSLLFGNKNKRLQKLMDNGTMIWIGRSPIILQK